MDRRYYERMQESIKKLSSAKNRISSSVRSNVTGYAGQSEMFFIRTSEKAYFPSSPSDTLSAVSVACFAASMQGLSHGTLSRRRFSFGAFLYCP